MESKKGLYLILAAPYLLGVGTLYLWAYWSTFDINVFEYANISDLVMTCVIPLGSMVIINIFVLFSVPSKFYSANTVESRDTASPKRRLKSYFLFEWKILLFAACMMASGYFLKVYSLMWFALIIFILPIVNTIATTSLFQEIEDRKLKVLALTIVTILPYLSFTIGKISADRIYSNRAFFYYEYSGEELKYIGYLKDKYFFTDKGNEKVVIIAGDKVKNLTLKKFKEPNWFLY